MQAFHRKLAGECLLQRLLRAMQAVAIFTGHYPALNGPPPRLAHLPSCGPFLAAGLFHRSSPGIWWPTAKTGLHNPYENRKYANYINLPYAHCRTLNVELPQLPRITRRIQRTPPLDPAVGE